MSNENLTHVIRMVLNDNKGQVLTEALTVGIEQCVLFYLARMVEGEQRDLAKMNEGENHGI